MQDLEYLKTEHQFLQSYLLLGVFRATIKEDEGASQLVTNISEGLADLEERVFKIYNPERDSQKQKKADERKEALQEIRESGPVEVSSLEPITPGERFRHTFANIRAKVLEKRKQAKISKTKKHSNFVHLRRRND